MSSEHKKFFTQSVETLGSVMNDLDTITRTIKRLTEKMIEMKKRILLKEVRTVSKHSYTWSLQKFPRSKNQFCEIIVNSHKIYDFEIDAIDEACTALPGHPKNGDFFVVFVNEMKLDPNENYFNIRYGWFSTRGKGDIPKFSAVDFESKNSQCCIYEKIYDAYDKTLHWDVPDSCDEISFILVKTENKDCTKTERETTETV